tara:strand:+ start:70 stop:759 length:690 start_codon:yes stop_codon:yes gene_type:complete
MNLLNRSGIQSSSNKDNNNGNIQRYRDQKKTKKFTSEKEIITDKNNSLYNYFIITLFISFIIFCSYVFISNSNNQSTPSNQFSVSEFFKELSNNYKVKIYSLKTNNGKISIVIDCKSENDLYKNLSSLKSSYPNIKIRISNGIYQLWINENYYNNNSISIDEVFNILNTVSNINVEKEIINKKLIIIGTLEDLKELFIFLEKHSLNNSRLDISHIEDEYNNIYYKLSIE